MKYRYFLKEINTEYSSNLTQEMQEMFDDVSTVGWKLDRIEKFSDYDTLNTKFIFIFYKTEDDE